MTPPPAPAASSCSAAFSQHPDTAVAVGEVVGRLLETLEPHPDLAVLLVSGALSESLPEIVTAINALLAPEALIGASAQVVFGGPREVTVDDGIALWAAHGPGMRSMRLTTDDNGAVAGLPADIEPGTVALVLGERSFPVEELATRCERGDGLSALIGGLTLSRSADRPTLLVESNPPLSRIHHDGAVGALIPRSLAQVFGFEVRLWDEDDPIPEPPIDPRGGHGALLFADRGAALSVGLSLDLEVVFDRYDGAVAGMVGRAITAPTVNQQRMGNNVAALIFG